MHVLILVHLRRRTEGLLEGFFNNDLSLGVFCFQWASISNLGDETYGSRVIAGGGIESNRNKELVSIFLVKPAIHCKRARSVHSNERSKMRQGCQ